MKLTINGVTVSFDNTPKEIIINGNDVSASIINNSNEDVRVSEYTTDNPKLVDCFMNFEGMETFTGVVKDKDVIAHYVNGEPHRDNGPAIEWEDGTKEWYIDGNLHRENGPAIEDADGYKEWWFDCEHYGYNDDYTNESWIAKVATLKGSAST